MFINFFLIRKAEKIHGKSQKVVDKLENWTGYSLRSFFTLLFGRFAVYDEFLKQKSSDKYEEF